MKLPVDGSFVEMSWVLAAFSKSRAVTICGVTMMIS
jgi:hypothetical protein